MSDFNTNFIFINFQFFHYIERQWFILAGCKIIKFTNFVLAFLLQKMINSRYYP